MSNHCLICQEVNYLSLWFKLLQYPVSISLWSFDFLVVLWLLLYFFFSFESYTWYTNILEIIWSLACYYPLPERTCFFLWKVATSLKYQLNLILETDVIDSWASVFVWAGLFLTLVLGYKPLWIQNQLPCPNSDSSILASLCLIAQWCCCS